MIQGTLFGECLHRRTIVITEKRGPQHAKEVCADCRKFLGWLPKPETVQRRKDNDEILSALSKLDDLTGWEREFIRSVVTHKNISPKQQNTIYVLRDKYFAGGLP